MMNKKDFTKIAKKILHPKPKLETAKPIYPMREWSIGLVLAIATVGASTVWSVHTYLKYESTTVGETSVVEEELVVYRDSMVKEALSRFAERETALNQLMDSVVIDVVDEEDENEEGEEELTSSDVQDNATSTPEVINSDQPDLVEESIVVENEEVSPVEELPVENPELEIGNPDEEEVPTMTN